MKKEIIIFSSVLLLTMAGCKKGYLEINNNPNNPTVTGPQFVLPNALTVTAGNQINAFTFVSEWMGYWAPSGSYAMNSNDLASYRQTTNFGDAIFQAEFHNLEDYNYVENSARTNNSPFYEAAAKIMKAYDFHQLVDMFNNIPYSEAFQGTAIIQPKYDDAKAIYESISLKLDTAVTLMKKPDAVAANNSDVLFGGDNSKWIKLANSLKLRILMRQTQMVGRSAYIQSEINKIIANGGGFLSTDAGVNPGFSAAQPNPFYNSKINTSGTYYEDFWRANQYPITFCKNNNDKRDSLIYAPASSDGSYVGNIIGSTINHPGNSTSTFGTGVLKAPSQDAILFTAAESYFLQAEAALRGYIPGVDAAALYKKGVQASFNYLGAGDASVYYSQPGNKNTTYEAASGFDEQLSVIIRQKWMAENTTTPFEAWCDYRRLHLPADTPLSQSPYVDVPSMPIRLLYPSSEYSTNAANVNAQGTINHHTSKIFWMP